MHPSVQRNCIYKKNYEHIVFSVHLLTCVMVPHFVSGIAGRKNKREIETFIQVPEGTNTKWGVSGRCCGPRDFQMYVVLVCNCTVL
jgi:hypothetical protein